jgi:hypothetical protein
VQTERGPEGLESVLEIEGSLGIVRHALPGNEPALLGRSRAHAIA